jgi:hypothetical protein
MPTLRPAAKPAAKPAPAPTGGPMTETDWAALVLKDMGAPVTTNNEDSILRWMEAEKSPTEWYQRNNPLNSGADTTAVDGTAGYSSLAVAAGITAGELDGKIDPAGYYTAAGQALFHNASVDTFAAAVKASPWASSHYADDEWQNDAVPTDAPTAPASAAGGDWSVPNTTADTASTGSGSAASTGAGSSGGSDKDVLFNTKMLVRIGIGVTACLVLLIGLDQIGHTGAGPQQVVVQGAGNTGQRAASAGRWGRQSTGGAGPPPSKPKGKVKGAAEDAGEAALA